MKKNDLLKKKHYLLFLKAKKQIALMPKSRFTGYSIIAP